MLFDIKKIILCKINENTMPVIFAIILGITFIVSHSDYSLQLNSYITVLFEIILIIFIIILNKHKSTSNGYIPCGKKYFYAWLISSVMGILMQRSTIGKNIGIAKIIIIVVATISCLFIILKLFKIKINDFNYKINLKLFLLSFLIGSGYIIINSIYEILSGNSLKNTSFFVIAFKLIYCFIYVGFLEETINRGLFISWLKSYNIPNYMINIIQAMIFGSLHYAQYGPLGIQSILYTSSQMIFGYLVGIIYLRTKSLMPVIIIHALFDFGIFIY